ncbi:DNA-3-methyladenine glycosylase 2 family protein [Soehngenia longivitae]|uniref:DNA-3-methyladenine glycosylase II n=1 Tax=Soehngenia longivitae TaxID=2562294 RepID=A0A4Z0D632_9FIRM|nr:DNA-3-methyladenine glycosylase [Soehngenia longivitae]TFZ40339.1 DNA-3-methyladenine glycosylase 2 family protein [Soehngenia longivitae]
MYFEYGNLEKDYLTKKDNNMAMAITQYGHIYREVEKDIFKALIKNILSQQISSKAYETILNKFIDLTKDFDKKRLLTIDEIDYRKCGISKRKAEYIKTIIGQKYIYGYDFDALKNLSDDEVIDALIKFPGVGKWTAQMTLIFSLERKDILSVDDFGIKKGLSMMYGEHINDRIAIGKYKDMFSPYSTIASFYIWEIAMDKEFNKWYSNRTV